MTSIRLPEELREELDTWCKAQRVSPKRTDVIIQAIREFLDRENGKKR